MNAFDNTQHSFQQGSVAIADPSMPSTGSGSHKSESMGSSMQKSQFEDAMDDAIDPKLNNQKPQKGLAKAEDNDPTMAKI
jgi:hypothetical protein